MAGLRKIPLLVVGGGIGGLATALAVSRKGQPVHVLEKNAEFAELGAGIQLAPNALRVLDRLGVLDEIDQYAVYPRRLALADIQSGTEITALELGAEFQATFGYRYLVMHRGDLLDILLAACRTTGLVTLQTNKEVETIIDLGDHTRVGCVDGSVYECEAMVGADGLWSPTRQVIIGDGAPIPSPFVAYRGPIPISQAHRHTFFNDMVIWIGPNMHFVQYLIHYGELYNQVAVFKSERYREDSDDWGTVDELDECFSAACPAVRGAYTRLWRDRRWPLVDRPPVDNWTRNRMTLLGDAAHPMFQYLAQGACLALEDALCLGDSLERHSDDPGKAFAAYQDIRIPRTALAQTTSRRFGEVIHASGLTAARRDALLIPHPHDEYSYVDWLYAY